MTKEFIGVYYTDVSNIITHLKANGFANIKIEKIKGATKCCNVIGTKEVANDRDR